MVGSDGEDKVPKTDTSVRQESSHRPAEAQRHGGDIHSYIGARLREAYDDVVRQPIPDRFTQLMRELDQA